MDLTTDGLSDLRRRWQTDSPARAAESAAAEAEAAARTQAQALARLAASVGQRYGPERTRLDAYRLYDGRQEPVLARMRLIVAGVAEFAAAGRGLLLCGPTGTGKDHLAFAALYAAAAAGFSCRRVYCPDLYGRIRDRMDQRPGQQREEELIAELAAPQVLLLSDPVPADGELSGWNKEMLRRAVNRRYEDLRPTWATLNVETAAEAEAALSAPVWDRLRESAEVIACDWPSHRGRQQ